MDVSSRLTTHSPSAPSAGMLPGTVAGIRSACMLAYFLIAMLVSPSSPTFLSSWRRWSFLWVVAIHSSHSSQLESSSLSTREHESTPTSRFTQVSVLVSRTRSPVRAVPRVPNVSSSETLQVCRTQLPLPWTVSALPCRLPSYLVFATSLYAHVSVLGVAVQDSSLARPERCTSRRASLVFERTSFPQSAAFRRNRLINCDH